MYESDLVHSSKRERERLREGGGEGPQSLGILYTWASLSLSQIDIYFSLFFLANFLFHSCTHPISLSHTHSYSSLLPVHTPVQDIIEASMSSEDRDRVVQLASQGAMHYQAEEDILYTPGFKRTRSAPTSSLAERYERLRSCTLPDLFHREGEASLSLTAPASSGQSMEHLNALSTHATSSSQSSNAVAGAGSTSALKPSHGSQGYSRAMPCSQAPHAHEALQSVKAATLPAARQSIVSAQVAALSPSSRVSAVRNPSPSAARAKVPDSPTARTIPFLSTEDNDDAVVPVSAGNTRHVTGLSSSTPSTPMTMRTSRAISEAGALSGKKGSPEQSRLSKKRGSDPTLEDIKLMKKKKKRHPFFRRERGGPGPSDPSSLVHEDKAGHRSWRQRMGDYVRTLLGKR